MSTKPLAINADGGAPVYAAVDQRRNQAMLLTHGVADGLGARSGVRPGGSDAITLAGQTVSIHPRPVVVYPAESSTDGPYIGHLEADTHTLDPADGSNDRIDIVVVRVYDDDHDSSGMRELVTEYIAGTPAADPDPPSAPSGTFVGAEIDVPSGGTPSPTLNYVAPFTVATGGVLPVRDEDELPTDGIYDGMTVWDADLAMMLVRHSGDWVPTSSEVELDHVTLSGTVGTGTNLTVPPRLRGLFRSYRLEIDAGVTAGAAEPVAVQINGDTGSNYRWSHQRTNAGNGNTAEDDANNSTFGVVGVVNEFAPALMVVTLRPRTLGEVGVMSWSAYGWANAGATESTLVAAGGRWSGSSGDIATFRVRTDDAGHTWSSDSSATLWGLR